MSKKFLQMLVFISPLFVGITENVNAMVDPYVRQQRCFDDCHVASGHAIDVCRLEYPHYTSEGYKVCVQRVRIRSEECQAKCRAPVGGAPDV